MFQRIRKNHRIPWSNPGKFRERTRKVRVLKKIGSPETVFSTMMDFFSQNEFCADCSQESLISIPKSDLGWFMAFPGPYLRLPRLDPTIRASKPDHFHRVCLPLFSAFPEVFLDSPGDSAVIFGISGIRRCSYIPKLLDNSPWSQSYRPKRVMNFRVMNGTFFG